MKKWFVVLLVISILCMAVGCGGSTAEKNTIKFAAAASLEKMFEQKLIPMYVKKNPRVKLVGSYAGSGKLQVQIEQGLAADVFISAGEKQMKALEDKGLVASTQPLLKNELVLIVPALGTINISDFKDFAKAKQPAIGDYKFVPAGQYAKEALEKAGLWKSVADRVSLGSNVVEVLNWVAQGSADAGLVYASDAAGNKRVKVVSVVSEALLERPIIYPLGVLKTGAQRPEVQRFVEFLQSQEAQAVYREYGFSFSNP